MSAIEHDWPWDQQPQEAVELNPGFPAIAGFVSSASGAQILAAGAADPYAAPTGPDLLFRVGHGGFGAGTAGSVTDTLRLHSVANQTDTIWEQPKAQVSVALFLRRNGNTGGNSPMFGNLDPNTVPYTAWGLIDAGGTGALRFECSAGGAYRSVTGGTLTNNEDYVIVATYDGSTARLYLRGVEVATGSFSGNLTYPNYVTRGPAAGNFFNYTGAGRAFNGLIYGGILHDGAWSPDLVRSISSPSGFWQFVRPQSIWVPTVAGGGPTNYPVTTAEAVTAADACSVMIGFWTAAPEAGSAVDASSQVASLSAAATESATAADTAGGTASGDYAASAAEAGSAADTSNRTFGATKAIAEAGAASDSRSVVAAMSKSVSESGAALDAQSSIAAFSKAAAESAAAADAASNVTSLSRATAEAASALDTVNGTASGDFTGTVLELGDAADVSSIVASLSAAASESAAAGETVSQVASLSATAVSTASAADSLAAAKAVSALIAEAMSAAESVNGSATGDYFGAVAEAGAATDTASQASAFFPAVAESAAAMDSAYVFNAWLASISESASAADVASQILNAIVTHSIFWAYAFPVDNVRYTVPIDDLKYNFGE